MFQWMEDATTDLHRTYVEMYLIFLGVMVIHLLLRSVGLSTRSFERKLMVILRRVYCMFFPIFLLVTKNELKAPEQAFNCIFPAGIYSLKKKFHSKCRKWMVCHTHIPTTSCQYSSYIWAKNDINVISQVFCD